MAKITRKLISQVASVMGAKGARSRMANMTAEEREAFARSGGKAGGTARAKALTSAQRSAIAKKAAAARWAKKPGGGKS